MQFPAPLSPPPPPPSFSARVDDLSKRVMSPTEMEEYFEHRSDFLFERHVTFDKIAKKFESSEKAQQRPILVQSEVTLD